MEQQLLPGSKRIPSEWLLRRYEWLGPDGVPLAPDFALSNSATQVADLAEWAYKNPASDGDTLDVEEPVEDELRLPLENSLFLRLSPALRRAHVRRKAKESSWAELVAAARDKAQHRHKRSLLRTALRNKYVASLKNSQGHRPGSRALQAEEAVGLHEAERLQEALCDLEALSDRQACSKEEGLEEARNQKRRKQEGRQGRQGRQARRGQEL